MNSFFKMCGDKKGDTTTLKIIIMAVILLIIAGLMIYYNVDKISKIAKTACTSYGYGSGYCVDNRDKCSGAISELAKCPTKMPFCCIEKDNGIQGTPSTSGPAASDAKTTTNASSQQNSSQLKGNIDFYCKCSVKDDYLTGPGWVSSMIGLASFQKLSVNGTKSGNTDFKAKKDLEIEVQARGTDDIKYCRISSAAGAAESVCNKDTGPSLKVKMINAGEYDITLTGYDAKDGKQTKVSIVDVNVEAK